MLDLESRIQKLADGYISAFEGFLCFNGFHSSNIGPRSAADESNDEWAECWQNDALCFFPKFEDSGEDSCNLINFWEISKILSAHCNSDSNINQAYFIIDLGSFYAICNFEIIRSFSKEHALIADYELIA